MAISFLIWWTQLKYVLYCIQSGSIPDISRIVYRRHHNINTFGNSLKLSDPAFWGILFNLFSIPLFSSISVLIST